MRLRCVVLALAWATALTVPATAAHATKAVGGQPDVQARLIEPDLYLVSGRDGNMLVLIGSDGPVVVGEPARALTGRAQQLLASLHAPPVRYVLIAAGNHIAERGDREWLAHGATGLAYEGIRFGALSRASTDPNLRVEVPTIGFSEVLQLGVDGEEIHAVHQAAGYSAADVSVHFEARHVLYLGPSFTTDGYPDINLGQGGSIDGLIATATKFIGMFGAAPTHVEPIVPGRGPVATMQDLREYARMLDATRQRVASLVKAGKTVDDVINAHPTAQFDSRWGGGPIAPQQFVRLVYGSLTKAK
jgi:cyclase